MEKTGKGVKNIIYGFRFSISDFNCKKLKNNFQVKFSCSSFIDKINKLITWKKDDLFYEKLWSNRALKLINNFSNTEAKLQRAKIVGTVFEMRTSD